MTVDSRPPGSDINIGIMIAASLGPSALALAPRQSDLSPGPAGGPGPATGPGLAPAAAGRLSHGHSDGHGRITDLMPVTVTVTV